MAADERWYFTKEQLANTPSRRCGYDVDKELSYRQQAANFIQDMGQRLLVTQLCINTAIVYMHRFYVFHSFTQFHRNAMAAASLFLAAKVEEQPRKLEHVIKVAHVCLHRDQQPLDTKSEAYLEQAQDLVFNENVLLQTLGFDVAIDHPHTHVVRCCHLVRASKDLAQTSYFMASNSLHLTTMCLQYKPTVVACFCIHLACKWSNWEIPQSNEGKDWFWYVDKSVSLDQLEQLTAEFLVIFDKCPTKLKHKIKSISATQNTSVPPSVSGSPFDSEPRRVRPPGTDSSIPGLSGSQDFTGSSLFKSSSSAAINTGSLQDTSGSSWISQHIPTSSMPPLPSVPIQPPPPPPPPSASASTYRDYREKKERERQEREKNSQTASNTVSSTRTKGDMRRPTIKMDGHHHHHHHHHGIAPVTSSSLQKQTLSSTSGVSLVKPSQAAQSTAAAALLLPPPPPPTTSSSSSMRPLPGVTAARDAARREAAHARDSSRRRAEPYGSFDPSLNHWSHMPDDAATDSRHRDKDRHLGQRLPPPPPTPPPPPLPPPPLPPPPLQSSRSKESMTGGLPDLGTSIKQELIDSGKHVKPDSYSVKVEPDSKKNELNSNTPYVHGVSIKQENSDGKNLKDYNSSSNVSSSSRSTGTGSSSSRHRQRPADSYSDGRPKNATPPKVETSNGKGTLVSVLTPTQHCQAQSSQSTQQQSHPKKLSSPHHHHHHHHKARSPHAPPQSGATHMKPPSSTSHPPSKSYYSSLKTCVSDTTTRNGTTQHEEVSTSASSKVRNLLRPPSTPPAVKHPTTPPRQDPESSTCFKASIERKSSLSSGSSSKESPYGQRSKRQRTPLSAKKAESCTLQQPPAQMAVADVGTPPPPPPPVALLSPFGSPPAAAGAPATPGKTVGRPRLRTSSSSSEPELVPLVTKLDQIAGFQNIGNSLSIRLPDTRVPELITPLRDVSKSTPTSASAMSCGIQVLSQNAESSSEASKPSNQPLSQMSSSQSSSQASLPSSQSACSSQPPPQPSDLGAVAFPSPATHAAVDPDDDGLFGPSSTVLDVVMSEALPSLDRMLEPGVHLPTTDVSGSRKPGEHHHKSDKKKKKEKHRRKEKDKDREKEKEKSPHKVHKVKHKKEKHKEKLDGVASALSLTTGVGSTGMPPTSAPIKITIPKDKLNLSLDPPHTVSRTSVATPSTGLKLKIQKDRLKAPEVPSVAAATSSSTPSGGLKIKISKDVLTGATPSGSSGLNKDSRKRERASPRGDHPPSKQARVEGSSSSSRRSYNKQNGVPASSVSSTTELQQSSQRGSTYSINKGSGRADHHHSSHHARSRSSASSAPPLQSTNSHQ